MATFDFTGKRVLVTQSTTFMGPALCEVFSAAGAQVLVNEEALVTDDAIKKMMAAAGTVDFLIANLAIPAPSTPVTDVTQDEWRLAFSHMVDPLPPLFAAVLPQMIERRAGKIVLMGSASALRGMKRASTYSAARGAQLAYVQAVGVEVARHGIQVNAIAQNFVDNETYFPAALQANPRFQERLHREVPLGRLVSPSEDANFAAYLCSAAADCFVGQVFPVCGSWVTR